MTTDTSILTAISNDYSYEQVFARQVAAHGRPGGVLMGISTSGGSRNVLAAMVAARSRGVKALAALPSLDELRAKIVGLIQAPATKIAQLTNAPAAKVARVVQAYASKGAAA